MILFSEKLRFLFLALTLLLPVTLLDAEVDSMKLLDSERTLKIGDELQYMVIEDREEAVILFVDENGFIEVPLLGLRTAAGQTPRSLASQLKKELEVDYYYQATVQIELHSDKQIRGQVFIYGQVHSQGPVDIPRGEVLTVSKAILRAGGFTERSDPTRVSLIRRNEGEEGELRMEINVAEIFDTGRLDKDLVVQPNDLISVAQRGDSSGKFTVSGAVSRPGIMLLPGGAKMTLSQAILQSGGFTEFANQKKVKIVRYNAEGIRDELTVDVQDVLENGRREKDVLLNADDMIIVPEKWISF